MKLNVVWILPLIYCSLNFCSGKSVVVDIQNRRSNEYLNVKEYNLPKASRKYVFSAKDSVDFAGVKYGKLKLTLRGKAKSKRITMYKSSREVLLAIPQGSNWKRSRKPEEAYYRVAERKIKKITGMMFSYYQHIMAWKNIVIDIQRPDTNVSRFASKDGHIDYELKRTDVFVLEVMDGAKHIWPDEKDKGGVFVRGIYSKPKGKPLFVVLYAGIDNQPKISYFQLSGRRWKRISDKIGKALSQL